MSLYVTRPQCRPEVRLNTGDLLHRPNNVFPCEEEISPSVESEIFEETPGVFGGVIYDQGTDAGHVLVDE